MLHAVPVPVLADNYAWVIGHPDDSAVVVADPGESEPVILFLQTTGRRLAGVLLTHHHRDHVGGISDLLARRRVPVWGPRRDRIPEVDRPVDGGDTVEIDGTTIRLETVHVPGHTAGHVAYVGGGLVLSGDALFAGGCGRLFEGSAEDLFLALGRLAALPPETRVCCAHEYTVANLTFATQVEPSNPALVARLEAARAERAAGRPTLPSTIAEELATNPFLRTSEPEIVASVERHAGRRLASPVEVLAALRRWKDGWR